MATKSTKEVLWVAVESALAAEDSPGVTLDRIVQDLAEDRR